MRLLARFERGFLAQALGVALGLADEAFGLRLRARPMVSAAIRRRLAAHQTRAASVARTEEEAEEE